MTNNVDRAVAIIDRLRLDSGPGSMSTAEHIAQALANAGLLTPDLPKPIINADDGNPEWHADEYTVDVDRGMVGLWTPDGTHWEQTPNRARALADALYAAANHKERRN